LPGRLSKFDFHAVFNGLTKAWIHVSPGVLEKKSAMTLVSINGHGFFVVGARIKSVALSERKKPERTLGSTGVSARCIK
jgi:hypothetical protein